MKTNKKDTKWHIFYRKNSGEEILLEMSSFKECLSASKELMTPSNYMICIERNGERINRWDREIIAGSNKWINCPPDNFEILSELITINKPPILIDIVWSCHESILAHSQIRKLFLYLLPK